MESTKCQAWSQVWTPKAKQDKVSALKEFGILWRRGVSSPVTMQQREGV